MNISSVMASYSGMQTSDTAKTVSGENGTQTANQNDSSRDTVRLSALGKALADQPEIIFPSDGTMQKLSTALAGDLKSMLSKAGIDPMTSVEFSVDPYTGNVGVNGTGPDAQKAVSLIRSNPDIIRQVHTIAGLGSRVAALSKTALANASALPQTNMPAAKYYSGYNKYPDVINLSLHFNGKSVRVQANSRPLISSQA